MKKANDSKEDLLIFYYSLCSFFRSAKADHYVGSAYHKIFKEMVKLDELDIKILSFLQEDSRMTIRDIAKELNISTTPIFNRIKRLEKEKVIDRYVAIVNADQVGKMLFAFVFLNLKDHSKKAIEKMEKQVTSFPEVLECHYVTGGADFFLKVIVKDIKEYNSFISEKLFSVPNIGKIESLLSLSMAKSTNVIPLE